MTAQALLLVACGGAIGACGRFALATWLFVPGQFPWPTLKFFRQLLQELKYDTLDFSQEIKRSSFCSCDHGLEILDAPFVAVLDTALGQAETAPIVVDDTVIFEKFRQRVGWPKRAVLEVRCPDLHLHDR